jgi:ABC-2 type transport system permease protein
MLKKMRQYQFLFSQLVHRDFTKKYKRTVLGMAWSVLNPLLHLLVMWLVFSRFFGNNINHYVIYMFAGNIVYSFFSQSTNQGMTSLIGNASIFTKVNVPKYLFLFSENVTSLINFGLTLIVFFLFVIFEGLPFTWKFILLLYPIICLTVFNLGCGLVLSAWFVFFRDIQYLWSVFTQLLMYLSAIFYSIDRFPQAAQYAFLCNPVYLYLRYFRKIVIDGTVPTIWFHLLAAFYALVMFGLGCLMYKKNNTKFLYYV